MKTFAKRLNYFWSTKVHVLTLMKYIQQQKKFKQLVRVQVNHTCNQWSQKNPASSISKKLVIKKNQNMEIFCKQYYTKTLQIKDALGIYFLKIILQIHI